MGKEIAEIKTALRKVSNNVKIKFFSSLKRDLSPKSKILSGKFYKRSFIGD